MPPTAILTCPQESAAQLFKDGRLDAAIDAQTLAVKSDPINETQRLFLFELLVLAGQWDRADRQLAALDCPDAERGATIGDYRCLLNAERQRQDVFATGQSPEFLMQPSTEANRRLEALQHLVAKQPVAALEILRQLDETEPPLNGQLNGTQFQLLRDADDLLGTVLEVFSSSGKYFWVPLQQVAMLTVDKPKRLRDLAWLPAALEMRDGPSGDVFLPVRYPGSESHPDDSVRLARASDWTSDEQEPVRGYGVHLYLMNSDALAICNWRTLSVL